MKTSNNLNDILNKYLYFDNKFNKSTRICYEYELHNFLNYFHLESDNEIESLRILTRVDIENYLELKQEGKCAAKARKLSIIKSFYKYLNKNELLFSNPVYLIPTPKAERMKPQIEHFNYDTFFDCISHTNIGRRDYLLFKLILELGINPSVLISLNIGHYSPYDKQLWVESTYYELPDKIAQLMSVYIDELHKKDMNCDDNAPLFYSTRNNRLSIRDINYRFIKYRNLSNNIPASIHNCISQKKRASYI